MIVSQFLNLLLLLSSCLALNSISAVRVSQIQKAIDATKHSSANITIAYKSTELWKHLLRDISDLPNEILGVCLVLYATCLVRTGQDDEAVTQFGEALKLRHAISAENLEEASLGRGRALQRLMQYGKAREQFLELENSESSVCGAATCALRLGDSDGAKSVLKKYFESSSEAETKNHEAAAMLGAVELLTQNNTMTAQQHENSIQLMLEAAQANLLYRWIAFTSMKYFQVNQTNPFPKSRADFSFLDLAAINLSPFDDHRLLHLDDKVLLHKLLKPPISEQFWPFGAVYGSCADSSQFTETGGLWIQKRRSGYGSHGNRVITVDEAAILAATKNANPDSIIQQMVDPPLLLEGRKFSLRIYVVVFPNSISGTSKGVDDVFISKHGLIKLASTDFSDSVDMSVHMTNSGRQLDMSQRSLAHLEKVFEERGWHFQSFWDSITNAVRSTMQVYNSQRKQQNPALLASTTSKISTLAIPKILGFDFVVDAEKNPWLVEVNRFPGMEPRDDSDRSIKQGVISDAWKMAISRSALSEAEIKAVFGDVLFHSAFSDSSPPAMQQII